MNSKPDAWQVYIIQTVSGKLYAGITKNINKRFQVHKLKKGAKFFRSEVPERVVYIEEAINRSEATKREMEIKQLTRIEKLDLIGLYA